MQLSRRIAWHAGAWVLVLSFFTLPVFFTGFTARVVYTLAGFLLYTGVFYINLLLILPRWVSQRRSARLLLSWLVLVFIYTLLFMGLDHLLHVFERKGHIELELLNTFLRNCLFVGIFLLLSTAYQSIVDWFRNERTRQQLENENLKKELALLRSQLNPHFLFNTLNTIYILAYQGSGKTADAVMKLSELMQFMLYESTAERIPLTRELHYIGQLIDLQQIRMKENICLDFSVSGSTDQYTVAPLLFIPFVENLFKHGILNDPGDPAVIRVREESGRLSFYSRNKISPHTRDATGGIGLFNVRRRMELLYAHKHHFEVLREDTHYSVNLTLQLD